MLPTSDPDGGQAAMIGGGVEITWCGHGTWLHRDPTGTRVLVDPWLSAPTTPASLHDPGQVDVIALTHGHVDHIADVEAVATKSGCPVLAKYELAVYFGGKGLNVVGFNTGGTVEAAGVRFTMTQAIHSGGITTGDAVVGYGGEPAGLVITFSNGFRIYQAGDTCVFGDMALIGEIYKPDVAILPIGDLFTMGPLDAAHAARLIGAPHVIGGHWGTFPGLTGTPEALQEELSKLGASGLTVHRLQPGDSIS
jgi:L-ascorbate metabolism protein UlaG (beta-lactamase superfamily)